MRKKIRDKIYMEGYKKAIMDIWWIIQFIEKIDIKNKKEIERLKNLINQGGEQ